MLQFTSVKQGSQSVSSFITWVRSEMAKRGMNQSQFAIKSGLSPASVHNLLNDEDRIYDLETYAKVAKGFDVGVDIVLIAAGFTISSTSSYDETTRRLSVIFGSSPWLQTVLEQLAPMSERQQQTVLSYIEYVAKQQDGDR